MLQHDLGFAGSRDSSHTGERLAPGARVHEPFARIGQRGLLPVERKRIAHTRQRQHVASGLLTQQRTKLFTVSAEGGTARYDRVGGIKYTHEHVHM